MRKNVVVYTAISGNYDILKDPQYISENCDYVCFTDNPRIKSNIWKIIDFSESDLDEVRKCRQVKILPHKQFSQYEYSVWIDGNIDITRDINNLINKYIIKSNANFVTFKHPWRDCIYDEAKECITQQKDNKNIINRQILRYKEQQMPTNIGLIESNVILRKHNSRELINVMEDWWEEVRDYSRRDQLSFNYVVWKNNFQYSTLKGNSRGNSEYFNIRSHKINVFKKLFNKFKKLIA